MPIRFCDYLGKVLFIAIAALFVILFIAPFHAHASGYNQYVTINEINVTKAWDADTTPEAVDVTMSYSTSFTLTYKGSDTDPFPDSIAIYYGDEQCGTAVKSGEPSPNGERSTQQYTVNLVIPFHFSSYTADEDTGLKTETIKLDSSKFSFSFGDNRLTKDNNYFNKIFYASFYSLVNLDAMENGTFSESSESGKEYDFSVDKSRTTDTQRTQNISGWTIVTTNTLAFTVTNKEKPSLKLTAKKTVNEGKPDQEYNFCLLDENGNVLQTKQNDSDGNISFDPIEYSSDEIGKEFTYQVKEQAGSDEDTTYDSSVYTVKVTPSQDPDDPSVIKVDPTITKDGEEVSEITFNNTVDTEQNDISVTTKWDAYTDPEALDVTMSYAGTFTLNYSGSSSDAAFPDSIQIYYGGKQCGTAVKSGSDSNQTGNVSASRVNLRRKVKSGSGEDQTGSSQQYLFNMEIPFHFSSYDQAARSETIKLESGEFSLSSDVVSLTGDNQYSSNGYSVATRDLIDIDEVEGSTFRESAASGKQYSFTVTKSKSDKTETQGGGSSTTHSLNFILTNSGDRIGALNLSALKTVNYKTPDQNYTFYLMDADGSILQTKQNDSDGNIKFDPIYYDNSDIGKKFTYQVKEAAGTEDGITYDSSIYTVTVTPVRDPDNSSSIIADPTITKDGTEVSAITFNNMANTDTRDGTDVSTDDTSNGKKIDNAADEEIHETTGETTDKNRTQGTSSSAGDQKQNGNASNGSVQTGDHAQPVLWSIVLISAAAMLVIVLRKRKHE